MNDDRNYQKNKAMLIELINLEMPSPVIQDYLKLSPSTIHNYINKLKEEGVSRRKGQNLNGRAPELALIYAKLKFINEIPGKKLELVSRTELMTSIASVLETEKIFSILEYTCRPLLNLLDFGYSEGIPLGYQRMLNYLNPRPGFFDNLIKVNKLGWHNYLRSLVKNVDYIPEEQTLKDWQSETIKVITDELSAKIRPKIAPVFGVDIVRQIEEIIFPMLDEDEVNIIKLRFGINGEEYSLQEIGKKLDKSGSRIGQIFQSTIRKLKNQHRLEILLAIPLTWENVSKLIPAQRFYPADEKLIVSNISKIRVSDIHFSARSQSVFKAGEITFLSEICSFSEYDLLKFRNLGRKSINDIKKILKKYGLSLKKSF